MMIFRGFNLLAVCLVFLACVPACKRNAKREDAILLRYIATQENVTVACSQLGRAKIKKLFGWSLGKYEVLQLDIENQSDTDLVLNPKNISCLPGAHLRPFAVANNVHTVTPHLSDICDEARTGKLGYPRVALGILTTVGVVGLLAMGPLALSVISISIGLAVTVVSGITGLAIAKHRYHKIKKQIFSEKSKPCTILSNTKITEYLFIKKEEFEERFMVALHSRDTSLNSLVFDVQLR